jgi:hypothetical protein
VSDDDPTLLRPSLNYRPLATGRIDSPVCLQMDASSGNQLGFKRRIAPLLHLTRGVGCLAKTFSVRGCILEDQRQAWRDESPLIDQSTHGSQLPCYGRNLAIESESGQSTHPPWPPGRRCVEMVLCEAWYFRIRETNLLASCAQELTRSPRRLRNSLPKR